MTIHGITRNNESWLAPVIRSRGVGNLAQLEWMGPTTHHLKESMSHGKPPWKESESGGLGLVYQQKETTVHCFK
ncbi:hypothetical protein HAX54_041451, partial [Datura stramonium]|nr:hypothetical protein [Datura stramonium]